jgi:ABC-type branched-subunit amino acid transport system ATPase component
MGRNGMGKTTLMKALMGVLPSRAGSVFRRAPRSRASSHKRVAAGFGYVPQGRGSSRP